MASNCTFAICQTNGTSVVCGLTCDPAASFVTRLVQLRLLQRVMQEYYKSISPCLTRILQRVLQRVLHLVFQLHRVLHSLQSLVAGVESLLTAIEVSLNGDCRFVHVGICLNDTSCLFQTEWRNWIWFAVLRKTNGQWACSERIWSILLGWSRSHQTSTKQPSTTSLKILKSFLISILYLHQLLFTWCILQKGGYQCFHTSL